MVMFYSQKANFVLPPGIWRNFLVLTFRTEFQYTDMKAHFKSFSFPDTVSTFENTTM